MNSLYLTMTRNLKKKEQQKNLDSYDVAPEDCDIASTTLIIINRKGKPQLITKFKVIFFLLSIFQGR